MPTSRDKVTRRTPMTLAEAATKAAREPLLEERQKTHGNFGENAHISQSMKLHWNEKRAGTYGVPVAQLCDVHLEALDMIALKISRILSGQATVKDHWDDIAGYAKLGAEVCNR